MCCRRCCNHPNLLNLIGYCADAEEPWILTEYHAGGNLKSLLSDTARRSTLDDKLIIRLASEVAAGLVDLHDAKPFPILHKDLKPQNVLVQLITYKLIIQLTHRIPSLAHAVICDFGVSSFLEHAGTLRRGGTCKQ